MTRLLRECEIVDPALLEAIKATPRSDFVTESRRSIFEYTHAPISCGQTATSVPALTVMLSALFVKSTHTVLEIGTGSGYSTAILAKLATKIITIDRQKRLVELAEQKFHSLKLDNVMVHHGNGLTGYPRAAPYHRIFIDGSISSAPLHLLDQLVFGGIMVVPIGNPFGEQELYRYVREHKSVRSERLGKIFSVPLISGKANYTY